jgi:hypothetical protein
MDSSIDPMGSCVFVFHLGLVARSGTQSASENGQADSGPLPEERGFKLQDWLKKPPTISLPHS